MSFMFFLPLIVMIGIITSLTDLKEKKIYNQHLFLGAVLSVILIAYVVVFNHEDFLFHISNCLVASLIGYLLFRSELWKGGDAKLFILYSFLMPVPYNNPVPFSSALNLFVCSFLAGSIILSPVFIKDIVVNYKSITNDLLSEGKRRSLFRAIVEVFSYSWILYPFYHLLKINIPVVILTASCLIFFKSYRLTRKIVKNYMVYYLTKVRFKLLLFISAGILLRIWLAPETLSHSSLRSYFIMITLSSVFSIFIKTVFDYFEGYQKRVPFAPMLFLGCTLSYTPFLTEIMKLTLIRNMLFQ